MAKVSAPLYKFADDIIMTPLSTEPGPCGQPSETRAGPSRSSLVQKIIRTFSMTIVIVVAALVVLALVTQAGVCCCSERAYPAQGRMVEVAGGALHVLDIGPRDAAGPPIVMLHGASSNLEVMRQPLGERLAKNHRVILIDRPGHGWSTRARLDELDARNPGPDDRRGAGKARRQPARSSWCIPGPARWARGSRWIIRKRVAGLVMLAPVAYPWPGGVGAVQQAHRHAGDRPAARLHHHAAARPTSWRSRARAACSCRRRCRTDLSRTPRRRCCCARANSSPMRAIW